MSSAVLIYKARGYNKRTDGNRTVKNMAHVEYIATRPGAWKEPEQESALFGSFNQQFLNVISVEDGMKTIAEVTDKYKTTYRDVISFTSEQAAHLGLNTLGDWKKYVKEQVLVIAKERGIKYENLEWEAAIHNKKGQPHAHIVMWDKSNAIQPNSFDTKLYKQTRRKLIQKTYKPEFQEFFKTQNEAKNVLRADSRAILKEFEEYLASQRINTCDVNDYLDGTVQFDVSGLSSFDILNTPNAEDILVEYLRVRMVVMKHKGRLAYRCLAPERKVMVDNFVKLLLNSNDKLKALADNFVSAHIEVFKFYSAKDNELKYEAGKYSKIAVKMIANALLQSMKDYQFEDCLQDGEAGQRQAEYIAGGILAAFANLARLIRQSSARAAEYNALSKSGDLSKEAIKELIKQRKDRGLEI
ncbi:MobP3 family relaxase [Ruminococcus sp. Marseille-P6503]|uniref:MobP3 family relaxase n=1 Tax=Ruminococcus sp. Marseille-P6503 TaxID=2364796 RepID=UPI000F540180|nr:MobP3 family relaxase [Ruminococcus sp. Marseille-P6503]